jgi:centromere protein C
MLKPKPAANADFSFQKIFGDGNFMAAGQLVIPPGGSKPTKGTKDNTFVRAFSSI